VSVQCSREGKVCSGSMNRRASARIWDRRKGRGLLIVGKKRGGGGKSSPQCKEKKGLKYLGDSGTEKYDHSLLREEGRRKKHRRTYTLQGEGKEDERPGPLLLEKRGMHPSKVRAQKQEKKNLLSLRLIGKKNTSSHDRRKLEDK